MQRLAECKYLTNAYANAALALVMLMLAKCLRALTGDGVLQDAGANWIHRPKCQQFSL